MNELIQHMRAPSSRIVGSTMASSTRAGTNAATPRIPPPVFDFEEARNSLLSRRFVTNTTTSPPPPMPVFDFREVRERYGASRSSSTPNTAASNADMLPNDARRLDVMHSELINCLNNIFDGQPINDDTIPPAINRAIQWFGETLLFLPQYEKPEYDSRDSLFNILRSTLPMVFELLKKNPVNLKEFENKLKQICEQFRKRLYSVLFICVGQANAEIFWVQLMRLLCNSVQTSMFLFLHTKLYSIKLVFLSLLDLRGQVVEFLTLYLTPTIPSSTDEADAQQFIVLRSTQSSNADDIEMVCS